MPNRYYLPINGDNLGAYFSKALIVPHAFLSDPIKDIQSKCGSCLILSENKVVENASCSIEVLLTIDEINSLLPTKNSAFRLLPKPLPISRISKIYFHTKEKLERTIGEAETSSYIPHNLLSLYVKSDIEIASADFIEIDLPNENLILEANKKLIDKFNSFLGGIAFMRMVKKDFGKNRWSNYSHNYFSTLSFFNKKIESQLSPSLNKFQLKTSFQSLFNSKDASRAEIKQIIYGSDEDIINSLQGRVDYRNNAFKQDTVIDNWKLYLYSVLANHGHDYNKVYRTDRLVNAIVNNPNEHSELVTLAYGLRNGYAGFQKLYLFNERIHRFKFELNSTLDYYTIESIYNKVFNDAFGYDFEYLKDVLPENYNGSLNIDLSSYYTYVVLDETVIVDVKPVSIKEKVTDFVKKRLTKKFFFPLVLDFSKKNQIKLTEEQKEELSGYYLGLLQDSFNGFIGELTNEMQVFYDEKIKELTTKTEQPDTFISSGSNYLAIDQQIQNTPSPKVLNLSKNLIDKNELLKAHEMYLRILNKTELLKQAEKYIKVGKKTPKNQAEVDSLIRLILDKIAIQY